MGGGFEFKTWIEIPTCSLDRTVAQDNLSLSIWVVVVAYAVTFCCHLSDIPISDSRCVDLQTKGCVFSGNGACDSVRNRKNEIVQAVGVAKRELQREWRKIFFCRSAVAVGRVSLSRAMLLAAHKSV